jgi:hypothetical protein
MASPKMRVRFLGWELVVCGLGVRMGLGSGSINGCGPSFMVPYAYFRLRWHGVGSTLYQFLSFVLTNEMGQLSYGFCLTFEDALRPDLAAKVLALRAPGISDAPGSSAGGGGGGSDCGAAGAGSVLVARKALCVVTQWPFPGFFRRCALLGTPSPKAPVTAREPHPSWLLQSTRVMHADACSVLPSPSSSRCASSSWCAIVVRF